MQAGLSSQRIKARAIELGFDRCGIAPAAAFPELSFLREWLDRGRAGEMAYLARTAEQRADVRHVVPSAKSVICAAAVYNVGRPCSTEGADSGAAAISRYAWGDDYHDVLGRQLEALLGWMREESPIAFDAKTCVDTGPVQERVYAQYAGLGWIGKNTCLIDPDLGSWLFLSEIVCSLDLEPDPPGFDRCGSCTLCLEACPTGAFAGPYDLDATRCLSYQTIEQRGAIPEGIRERAGAHVYGCDVCQDVCPWNQLAAESGRREWQPRPALDRPRLVDLWRRSDRDWHAVLRQSPRKRAKLAGLRRNLAVALGNSRDPAGLAALEESSGPDAASHSPSIQDPLVQEHVDWARRRLAGSTCRTVDPRRRP